MKKRITSLFLVCWSGWMFAQADCQDAEYVCNDNGFSFVVNSSGDGSVIDLCTSCTTNPDINPGTAGNMGCLLSGENDPTWLIISIAEAGILEFTLGAGGGGLYDWAMWAYEDNGTTTTCDFLHNNTQAPVACNWNWSSDGFTGMYAAGALPPGADAGNFENGLLVNAGDQFILCFSNWSGQVGVNVPVFFGNQIPGNNNPNSATVTCTPNATDQTICEGASATVTISTPGFINPTFNWLVTTGVSDPTSGTDVIVTPTVTTEYVVEISEGNLNILDTFVITVVSPPTPNAGIDGVTCINQAIALNGTLSDAANTSIWSHTSTGTTGTPTVNYNPNTASLTPSVTMNQAGTYTFTLSEDNGICPPATDQVQIVVSNTTHTTTWVGPSCAGLSDGSITITNPNAVDYSFDGGMTWVTSNTMTGLAVGSYIVRSRNQYGCVYSSTVVISEPAQIQISVSNDTTICQNGSVMLSAFANVTGISIDYIWSHTSNTYPNVSSGVLNETTVYSVYAQGPGGCISPTVDIEVTVRPVLSAVISEYDTICPGYPTSLEAHAFAGGLPPYTLIWSTGDTLVDVYSSTIEVNPPVTTLYTATLKDVCETTPIVLTTQVYVAPLPEPIMSVVEPILCEPAVFEIHNETDSTMMQSYVWYYPNNLSAINEPIVFTDTLMNGTYDVQLIVTSPLGCIDSITNIDFLEVQRKPEAIFSWSPNPVLMFNTEVSFQNMSYLGHTYEWYFPGAVPPSSTLERPRTTYPDGIDNTYPVTLIVTSELGCVDTLTQDLIVYPEVILYAPTAFTPDGDEFNQTWKVVVEGIDIHSFHLQIFNRWGEMVFESYDALVGWDGTYNGKTMPLGAYNWKISARDVHHDGKYEWVGHFNLLK